MGRARLSPSHGPCPARRGGHSTAPGSPRHLRALPAIVGRARLSTDQLPAGARSRPHGPDAQDVRTSTSLARSAGSGGRADLSQRELARPSRCRSRSSARPRAARRASTSGSWPAQPRWRGCGWHCSTTPGTRWPPMAADAVRDMGNRRFPAHLDTRYGDEGWWHGPHRYDREQPWYTFDRDRRTRDRYRRRDGTPDDHQLPQPGDSPPTGPQPGSASTGVPAPRNASSGSWPAGSATSTSASPAPAHPACDELDDRRAPGARGRMPVFLRRRLSRCYRGGVRGSLLLMSRGEALS